MLNVFIEKKEERGGGVGGGGMKKHLYALSPYKHIILRHFFHL